MERVLLIHWNQEEAEPRLEALRKAGVDAELAAPDGGAALRKAVASPPRACVIDLTRLPSHGRAVAAELRKRKSTRLVPLIFAGGEPDKVARARELLPDAHYCEWKDIARVLRRALASVPEAPVVPQTTIESNAPLTQKLGIKPGCVLTLLGAPARFERKLEPLPEGVRLIGRPRNADRVLLFAASLNDLGRTFDGAAAGVKPGGGLWIFWPKQASGVETDLTMPVVRAFCLDLGWVDYRVCSVDKTWSGMLFAQRAHGKASARPR